MYLTLVCVVTILLERPMNESDIGFFKVERRFVFSQGNRVEDMTCNYISRGAKETLESISLV